MATEIQIDGTRFLINGKPTYEKVTYRGKSVDGLLFNSRMVQTIFDDENPETPVRWRYKLRQLKDSDDYKEHPRPILVNEDSVFAENLEAAVDEHCSWGFYCQGYGSHYQDRMDWTVHGRETCYEDLSGFQTVPVNWSINTDLKRAFFSRLAEIAGYPGGRWVV